MKTNFLFLLSIAFIFNVSATEQTNQIKKNQIIQLCKIYKDNRFFGYPLILNLFKPFFRSNYNQDNPYRFTKCDVRLSNDICQQEKNAIQKRLSLIKNNLEYFLKRKIDEKQVPKIAICSSGGGYRAMIATLGFLIGAQEIGLLNNVLYSSSLSGSTWVFNSLTMLDYDLKTTKETMKENLSANIKIGNSGLISPFKDSKHLKKVISNMTCKYLFNQPLGLTDIWGSLISSNIFSIGQDRQSFKLSHQQEKIKNGNIIFPIYTAIEPQDEDFHYNWFEFTPYEVGSHQLNSFIPIWAFGRQFKNGTSVALSTTTSYEYPPEQALSNLLGIFGSAFNVNLEEIIKIVCDDKETNYVERKALEALLSVTPNIIEEMRIMPAQIPNFNFSLNNAKNKNNEYITLIDAGIDCNLPFVPLLRPERKIDIIIVLDSSSDLKNAPELEKAQNYAKLNNLKFPKIDYKDIQKKSLTIFYDKNDTNTPLVIYMPFAKDISFDYSTNPLLKDFDTEKCMEKGFCSTFNLSYTKEQFDKICQLTQFNMIQNKEKIKQIINEFIDLHQ